MARVRGRDTKPELLVRRALHQAGYRFRVHARDLPGTPDLAFTRRRTAVFVHGCFWHGHDCARGAREPKTNAEYWRAKIARNRARDKAIGEALAAIGWRAVTVWECELRSPEATLDALMRALGPPRG
jgi:DNA mismatch endonuclease (patch repair protein)